MDILLLEDAKIYIFLYLDINVYHYKAFNQDANIANNVFLIFLLYKHDQINNVSGGDAIECRFIVVEITV